MKDESDTTVLLDYTTAGGWNVLPDFAPTTITEPAGDTPRMDAAAGRVYATGKQGEEFAIELAEKYRLEGRLLERELAAAQAQRDKARDDALEQAAKVCEQQEAADHCAAAIRAMKVEK